MLVFVKSGVKVGRIVRIGVRVFTEGELSITVVETDFGRSQEVIIYISPTEMIRMMGFIVAILSRGYKVLDCYYVVSIQTTIGRS